MTVCVCVCVCAFVCVFDVVVSGYIRWELQCSGSFWKMLFFRITTYLLGWVIRLWLYFFYIQILQQTQICPQKHSGIFSATTWLTAFWRRSTLPSDNGPDLSLCPRKEYLGVWWSTAFWPWPKDQQHRGKPKSSRFTVSLPAIRVWGEAVCREEDRWERDEALSHACEWQKKGGWGKSKETRGGMRTGSEGKNVM